MFEKLELIECKRQRVTDLNQTQSAMRGPQVEYMSESESAKVPRTPLTGLRLSQRRS